MKEQLPIKSSHGGTRLCKRIIPIVVKTLPAHSIARCNGARMLCRDANGEARFPRARWYAREAPRERSTIDRTVRRGSAARETAICDAHNFAARRSRCEAQLRNFRFR